MTRRAAGMFEVKSWNEVAYDEEGPKLTRASVIKELRGEIEGLGKAEYLMMYRNDGSASFVGLERIVGRIGTRKGSFVLQHIGTFAGGLAKETWVVVPGSGTGDLEGLRGEGGYESAHAGQYRITLDYEIG
ncbi:MAG TPA: DUF3224 domain-containing protein [Thermoanaerobaculia bacterium]